MHIIILSPNVDLFLTPEHKAKLEAAGEVVYITKVQPFTQVQELYKPGDKIVAVDPDFSDWSFPNEVIDKIPDLKAVCLQTTSFSWTDVAYAGKKGIPVMNLRGFSSNAVAEWAVMMAMNVARKIPVVIQDSWKADYTRHKGIELRGRTAGIIGLGSIGTRMAEICQGLGMNVVYWSKNSKDDRFKYVELAELMKTADLIMPAVAQNEETKGLITDDMLKSMKQDAIFVSIVHQVYNHDLLMQLVQEGKIYGYANEEDDDNPSTVKGNVWTGVELAWCTTESMKRNAEQWVESIVHAAQGKYPTRVN